MVRTSEKRTKKDFDTLAEKIEEIWNLVVRGIELQAEDSEKNGGEGEGKHKEKDESTRPQESEKDPEAKRLHAVFLYPMVAARESGIVIPTVSDA